MRGPSSGLRRRCAGCAAEIQAVADSRGARSAIHSTHGHVDARRERVRARARGTGWVWEGRVGGRAVEEDDYSY